MDVDLDLLQSKYEVDLRFTLGSVPDTNPPCSASPLTFRRTRLHSTYFLGYGKLSDDKGHSKGKL